MSGTEFLTYELSGWKGLNTDPNISDKDPHYVEDCQNVDFDEAGMITKRRGTIRVATTISGTINMIYHFQSQLGFKDTDDKQRVVIVAGSTLYVMKMDNTIDAVFATDDVIHYAATSDNGVCYITRERNSVPPYMLCYEDV